MNVHEYVWVYACMSVYLCASVCVCVFVLTFMLGYWDFSHYPLDINFKINILN